jgi:hypothetical protein
MNQHLGPEAAAPFTSAEAMRMNGANTPDEDGECLKPVPADAGPPPQTKLMGRKADRQFTYPDGGGNLLGYVQRWEARGGDRKEFRPITYWRDANGKCGWKVRAWPGARPLYGLDKLAAHPDAIVLLVEGEKTAEAVEFGPLADAFKWDTPAVIGITWPGGGKAIEYVDFSPLAGREVVILPDADGPGEKTADALVDKLQQIGISRLRRWKAPAEVADGWDIADAIPPGLQPDDVAKSILEAPEIAAPRLVLTLPEFLATYESPDYLVDGLFQRSRFYALTALTGAGKTAVALLLSVTVADPKRRWKFGPHEVEHGRVLYVSRENPDDVKMRLIGMASKMGFDPEELAGTFLVIQSVGDIEKHMERIRSEVIAFGDVVLVILDTSAALFVGDNENDPIQMLKHALTQRKLTTLPGRPCVVALNHPIKNASNPEQLLPRGGGGYLNETDGNFTLWAHGDRMADFYYAGKFRGPDFEKITFRMVTINTTALLDKRGRILPTVMAQMVTDADLAASEEKLLFQDNRLLAAIRARPEGSIAEWAVDCGWMLRGKDGHPDTPYRSLAHRVLTRLVKDKMLAKEGRGYILTKAGKAAASTVPAS